MTSCLFIQEVREFRIRDKRVVIEEELDIEMEPEKSFFEGFVKKRRVSTILPPVLCIESHIRVGDFVEGYADQGRFRAMFSCYKTERATVPMTQTFSYKDFSDCQCSFILASMYKLLLDHYRGAGKYIITLCISYL